MNEVDRKMYIPTGEIYILIDGTEIKAEVSEDGLCTDCVFYFRNTGVSPGCSRFSCGASFREDHKNVVFKRVINQ